MKKIFQYIIISILLIGIYAHQAQAIEIVRQKNVATYITFPIVDADGDIVTGATGLDSEIDTFADGTAPDGFTDCTNEATEVGSTGIYYLSLTQSEMNADYIYIQTKTSTSGAKTQHILIRTTVGDPLNASTTDDGGTINVTTGKIDEVSTLTGNTAQTGDAYAIVNNGTYGNSALNTILTSTGVKLSSGTGAGQISLSSGLVSLAASQPGVTIGTVTNLTNAPSDSSGVTTLLSRLSATRAGYLDNLTYLDAAVSSRLAAANITLSSGKVTVGTNDDKTGYSISGTKTTLDALNDIAAADVWSSATRTLSDYSGVWSVASRTITGLSAAALADFFDTDSGTTYASAVSGSVVKEIADNAGGSSLTPADIWGYETRTLTAGTNIVLAKGTGITGFNDITAQGVWEYATRELTDKSGFSLTQSFPANFADLAITATTGQVTVGTNNDKTGYGLADDAITAAKIAANAITSSEAPNLDAAVSSRLASASYTAPDNTNIGNIYSIVNSGTYGNSALNTAIGNIPTNVFNKDISAYSAAGYAGTYIKTLYDNWTSTRAGYIDKLNVSGTLANTDNAASFKATGFSTHSAADVVTAMQAVSGDFKADVSGLATAADLATTDGKIDSILEDTGTTIPGIFDDIKGSTFNTLTDSLEAIRNRGDAAWITATGFSTLTAQNVWEYATRALTDKSGFSLTQSFPANFADLTITATTGQVTVGTNNDKTGYSISGTKTTLDSLNDIAATDVWSAGTRTLTSGGYSGLTADDIDAIWDEVITGHTTLSSFAKLLIDNIDAAISTRSNHSAADVATEILETPANKLATDEDGKVTVTNPGTTVY